MALSTIKGLFSPALAPKTPSRLGDARACLVATRQELPFLSHLGYDYAKIAPG